jgi:hypothetical protein
MSKTEAETRYELIDPILRAKGYRIAKPSASHRRCVDAAHALSGLPVFLVGALAASAWHAHLIIETGGQEHTNGFALVL